MDQLIFHVLGNQVPIYSSFSNVLRVWYWENHEENRPISVLLELRMKTNNSLRSRLCSSRGTRHSRAFLKIVEVPLLCPGLIEASSYVPAESLRLKLGSMLGLPGFCISLSDTFQISILCMR